MQKQMSKRMAVTSAGLAIVVLSAVWLAGCGNAAVKSPKSVADSPAKIKVVAAENFYGEVAQAVGGDQVQVTSILTNPEQDPHEYEPTTDASKAVSDAQIVVYTGIGYDDWMDKLLKSDSAAKQKSIISVGSDLLGKASGDNPHIWYDPTAMPKLAAQMASDLSKIDPDHAKDYQQRAKDYISSLAPFTDKVAKLKQSSPVFIDVSEPVFGYLSAALNLQVQDPEFAKVVEDGNDPAPAQVAAVQDDMKSKKIKMFVVNTQTQSPTVDHLLKLAETSGVPIVQVTETEPTGKVYVQWMTDQLDQVAKALGKQ